MNQQVSKNTVEQTIDTSDTELSIPTVTQNVNIRVPFNNTFTSVQDDIIEIELISSATVGEEVLVTLYGFYTR